MPFFKKEKPAHSRLESEQILGIFQLYFAGYSTKGISNFLNLPTQTVNRNLDKIRRDLISKVQVLEYLEQEAAKSGFERWADYSTLYRATLGFRKHAQEKGEADLKSCVMNCPRAMPPKDFAEQFIGYHVVQDHWPYVITAIFREDVSIEEFHRDCDRRMNCRPCPVPGGENIANYYSRHPMLYAEICQYFITHRIRGASDFSLHYSVAILLAATHQIVDMVYDKAMAKSLTPDQAQDLAMRKFRRLTQKLFDIFLLPTPEWSQTYKHIL